MKTYLPPYGWQLNMIRVASNVSRDTLVEWIARRGYVLLDVQPASGEDIGTYGTLVKFAAPKDETFDSLRPYILPPR